MLTGAPAQTTLVGARVAATPETVRGSPSQGHAVHVRSAAGPARRNSGRCRPAVGPDRPPRGRVPARDRAQGACAGSDRGAMDANGQGKQTLEPNR